MNRDDVLRQGHERMAALEVAYLRAKELLGDRAAWAELQIETLERVEILAVAFDGKPDTACFTLGRIKEALRAVESPRKTIMEYEHLKEQAQKLAPPPEAK